MRQEERGRRLVAAHLKEWMKSSQDLRTQVALSERSGVAQTTISRILRADTNVCADTMCLIAIAFNREAGDLLRTEIQGSSITYDRERYARLPVWEKARIEAFIASVIAAYAWPDPATLGQSSAAR